MRKKVVHILSAVILAGFIFSLRWSNTPDFEKGFDRSTLTIDDAYDIIERVVSDLPLQDALSVKPEKGYVLIVFDGHPSAEFIKRFRKYSIPKIRRGYIKHWAQVKYRAQIEIKKMVEVNNHEVRVMGVIRYPKMIVDKFEYGVLRSLSGWEISFRRIFIGGSNGN